MSANFEPTMKFSNPLTRPVALVDATPRLVPFDAAKQEDR